MSARKRVAFCTVPHTGGIYSVYQKLRLAVQQDGWEVFGVEVGDERQRWEYNQALADEGCRTIALGERDPQRAAQALTEWLTAHDVDVLMPMLSHIALSAVPHLPREVRVVSRCVNNTPQAYGLATEHLDRLSRVVVTSPRTWHDLARYHRVDEDRLRLIPNAVDTSSFTCSRTRQTTALRLAYVGRLFDREKGVFLIPRILRILQKRNTPYHLVIAGDGSDRDRLRAALADDVERGDVAMVGAIPQSQATVTLENSDVALLPSKHDGFPNVLIEAMAAGAVPIASRIAGVTDWIVRDGQNGILCPIDSASRFAEGIARLHADRSLLLSLSHAARESVCDRFDIGSFAEAYVRLFEETRFSPHASPAPLPWSRFDYADGAPGRSMKRWLPRRFKDRVRVLLERHMARTQRFSEPDKVMTQTRPSSQISDGRLAE